MVKRNPRVLKKAKKAVETPTFLLYVKRNLVDR